MIIVTGAAGFIGSCMVNKLNNKGFTNLVLADDFSSRPDKLANLQGKSYSLLVHRDDLHLWLDENHEMVEAVCHLGARTDTTETDVEVFNRLNLNYSKRLFGQCAAYRLPIVYASSAATYGAGELGYSDDHDIIRQLLPLNPYGASKNDFDQWVLAQPVKPPFWAGMKFFNVFGPNEYHKGRMASVVFHAYRQIRDAGQVTLFRSHKPEFENGGQSRDFIYVKDVVSVLFFMLTTRPEPGMYNLGTGHARSFNDLAAATFNACGIAADIRFVDTPADIRDNYQYFTEAAMEKLKSAGYTRPFFSLEEAISDYVQTYLDHNGYY
jgi:ADP-L-glycero-D-manno-heptose 6-epimerase